MGLPVTLGDPFEGETLDGLAGIPVRFGSCRGGWNVLYDSPPEFTENRHRVPEWCRHYGARWSAAPKVSLCGVSPFRKRRVSIG